MAFELVTTHHSAADRWRRSLADWAIPAPILAEAVSFPYEMDPALFRPAAEPPSTPTLSTTRAAEALSNSGSVIDVGCGGGAATMALAGQVTSATGVDQSAEMLDLFVTEATSRGIDARGVEGTWPDVADAAGRAEVVLCHHVAYNVAELSPFVLALDAAASRRVVMELTISHPQSSNAPLWRQFWNLERPAGPTADDALAVITEAGIDAQLDTGEAGALRRDAPLDTRAVTATRMLCLGPDRLDEVRDAVAALPPRSNERAVIWWDVS